MIIEELHDGFNIKKYFLFMKREDGWTRSLVEQVIDALEVAYDYGYEVGEDAAAFVHEDELDSAHQEGYDEGYFEGYETAKEELEEAKG